MTSTLLSHIVPAGSKFPHGLFNLRGCCWNIFPQLSRASFFHDKIPFESYSTKIHILPYLFMVQILPIDSTIFPLLYQSRDKIDSRLHCKGKSRLDLPSQSHAPETEPLILALTVLKSHQIFAVIFHVVDIHSYHMTQSVWKEEGVDSLLEYLFFISPKNSQFQESSDKNSAGSVVGVKIFFSWKKF